MSFEIHKRRFGFKLTALYSEERWRSASDLEKRYTENLKFRKK